MQKPIAVLHVSKKMASLPLAATVKNLKVGFIGAGKMATALAAGLADILPQVSSGPCQSNFKSRKPQK